MKDKIKWYVVLHIIILMYSLEGIAAKSAAQYDFLSPNWIFYYGIVIVVLGFYALAWQQVLKHLPLITAYANKAVTTIWGLIWGALIFAEGVSVQKIIGAAIIIVGVYLVVTGENTEVENDHDDGMADKAKVASDEKEEA